MTAPLLSARGLSKRFGAIEACRDISFELEEGEALAIVGESGSGKTTLLNLVAGSLAADSGEVVYRMRDGAARALSSLSEAERRALMRTDWGFVHQDSTRGLRMNVSAGGNIGERLMAIGDRHYGRIRAAALDWLARVEIAAARLDDPPSTYSGGMRQRLQIARNLVTGPRLVFMDEPTGGLDVSVQARLLGPVARPDRRHGAGGDSRHPRPRRGAAAVASHPRHEAGRGDRERPDRPGARRPAGALHPVARVLGARRMTALSRHELLRVEGLAKTFTLHLHGGARLPVVHAVSFSVARRRMRRPRRPVGGRQVVDPQDGHRQLSRRRGPHSHRRRRADDRRRARRAARNPRPQAARGRLRQPVSARHSARRRARHRRRRGAGGGARPQRGARRAPPACWPACACPKRCGACRRRLSPAASNSGSTSPAASPAPTACWCSTSRPLRSTPPTARR